MGIAYAFFVFIIFSHNKKILSHFLPPGRDALVTCLAEVCKTQSCPCNYLIKHYAMKAYGEVGVQIHVFLISALFRVEWWVGAAE
jgi:hypothetical protein